ncbi:MAG: hypothetical protein LBM67_09110 [Lentimicrobiaceae bacterium]|nr:hypothetical protein [Lentimicrobiaceae bacterium]
MTKKILSLSLLLLIFASCNSSKQTQPKMTHTSIEDHVNNTFEFLQGVYYIYVFDGQAYGFNDSALAEQLLQEKIAVKDIWYKGGSSMCVAPGSNIGTTALVQPVFLVRLETNNEKMQTLGFEKVREPSVGDCAYNVKHYIFK